MKKLYFILFLFFVQLSIANIYANDLEKEKNSKNLKSATENVKKPEELKNKIVEQGKDGYFVEMVGGLFFKCFDNLYYKTQNECVKQEMCSETVKCGNFEMCDKTKNECVCVDNNHVKEDDLKNCVHNTCKNKCKNGFCKVVNNAFECKCHFGYSLNANKECVKDEKNTAENNKCNLNCNLGEECKLINNQYYKCDCMNGYFLDKLGKCTNDKCKDAGIDCGNGICDASDPKNLKCACEKGFVFSNKKCIHDKCKEGGINCENGTCDDSDPKNLKCTCDENFNYDETEKKCSFSIFSFFNLSLIFIISVIYYII